MRFRYVVLPVMLALLVGSFVIAGRNHEPNRAAAEAPPVSTTELKSIRPNVVMISLDTVRPDHLGCYGYEKGTSPNLDQLAGQGVVFRRTWSQAPWTLPSHMSLFTSLPPSRHRVDSINRVLPDGIATFTEVLQGHGYRTAALVNDAQMSAHWGFDCGFDVWREFPVDTPEGNCENITRQAVDWLDQQSDDDPFFLFLHYYDAHDAYAAPEAFRKRFSSLSGDASRAMAWRARFPGQPLPDPEMKQALIGAYDAEIAWLDYELGKLFDAMPENTLVVVFSDHGEAFEEHGWTLHGATLYEEETRVALLMRLPGGEHAGRVVDAPASLLDVAPTILRICGAEVPAAFEGIDLAPAVSGQKMPSRIVTSETKAVMEGTLCRSAIAYPWKLIVSEPNGRCELYRLPDESTDLASTERPAVEALKRHIANGLAHENYWMVRARGAGRHEITIEVEDGKVVLFIPHGFEQDRDSIQTSPDGRRIQWVTYPGEQTRSLYVELSHADARLTLDVARNGSRRVEQVFIGRDHQNPSDLPCRLPNDHPLRPMIDQPALDDRNGVQVVRFAGQEVDSDEDNTKRIDEEVLRQLRALNYVE